jgi:hypothetical protein
MSEFDTYYDQLEPRQPRTSALAVSSLVCSLICCLPGVPLIGVLLGIGGIVATSRNPSLQGRGLAITGLVLGILLTIGQALIILVAAMSMAQFRHVPAEALRPGFAGDYAGFREHFGVAGRALPDDDAAAFIAELRDRYGELVESRIDWAGMGEWDHSRDVTTFTAVLVFDREEVKAAFVMDLRQTAEEDMPILQSIRIIDRQRGDVMFPLTAPPPPSPMAPPPEVDADDEPEDV